MTQSVSAPQCDENNLYQDERAVCKESIDWRSAAAEHCRHLSAFKPDTAHIVEAASREARHQGC